MDRGYIPIWRKSEDSTVFRNAELWRLWTLLLMRATHKPYTASVKTGIGDTDVSLLPGDVLFGRFEFAKALRCPPGSIPKRIQKLISLGNITIKSNTHYSIVSIVNWNTYADAMNNRKQPRKQPGNNQETHTSIKNTITQDQENGGTRKRFRPPTLEEVTGYCKERNNGINPQLFIDKNTAIGWKVGRNPMIDWKATVRTWEAQEWNKPKATTESGCSFPGCKGPGSQVGRGGQRWCRAHVPL